MIGSPAFNPRENSLGEKLIGRGILIESGPRFLLGGK